MNEIPDIVDEESEKSNSLSSGSESEAQKESINSKMKKKKKNLHIQNKLNEFGKKILIMLDRSIKISNLDIFKYQIYDCYKPTNLAETREYLNFILKETSEAPDKFVEYSNQVQKVKLPESINKKLVLNFDSNFECGNLDSAFIHNVFKRNQEYNLLMKNDSNTHGNTCWFYFKVSNLQVGCQYRFNIMNFNKRLENFYLNGMNIMTKLENQDQISESDDEISQPLESEISTSKIPEAKFDWEYNQCQNIVFQQSPDLPLLFKLKYKDSQFMKLSFSYTFQAKDIGKHLYFAYAIPYTFSKIQNDLFQIQRFLLNMQISENNSEFKDQNQNKKKTSKDKTYQAITTQKQKSSFNLLQDAKKNQNSPWHSQTVKLKDLNKNSYHLKKHEEIKKKADLQSVQLQNHFEQSILKDQNNNNILNQIIQEDTNIINILNENSPSKSDKYQQFQLNFDVKTDYLHYKQEVVGQSMGGLNLYLISITKRYDPLQKNKKKKIIFIQARQHPSETHSSFIMQNILKNITQNPKKYDSILSNTIIKLVPIVNPDGVVIGNSRSSLAGVDLNRRWSNPSATIHPEAYFLKNYIQDFYEQATEISIFCDLHGHSKQMNCFFYGSNRAPNEGILSWTKTRLLPKIFEKNEPIFDFKRCKFATQKEKYNTARVVLWNEFKVTNSFTLETSMFAKQKQSEQNVYNQFRKQGESVQLVLEDFNHISQSLIKSFCQYNLIEQKLEKEFKTTRGWLKKKTLDEITKVNCESPPKINKTIESDNKYYSEIKNSNDKKDRIPVRKSSLYKDYIFQQLHINKPQKMNSTKNVLQQDFIKMFNNRVQKRGSIYQDSQIQNSNSVILVNEFENVTVKDYNLKNSIAVKHVQTLKDKNQEIFNKQSIRDLNQKASQIDNKSQIDIQSNSPIKIPYNVRQNSTRFSNIKKQNKSKFYDKNSKAQNQKKISSKKITQNEEQDLEFNIPDYLTKYFSENEFQEIQKCEDEQQKLEQDSISDIGSDSNPSCDNMNKTNILKNFGEVLSEDELDFDSETEFDIQSEKQIIKVYEISQDKKEDEQNEESLSEKCLSLKSLKHFELKESLKFKPMTSPQVNENIQKIIQEQVQNAENLTKRLSDKFEKLQKEIQLQLQKKMKNQQSYLNERQESDLQIFNNLQLLNLMPQRQGILSNRSRLQSNYFVTSNTLIENSSNIADSSRSQNNDNSNESNRKSQSPQFKKSIQDLGINLKPNAFDDRIKILENKKYIINKKNVVLNQNNYNQSQIQSQQDLSLEERAKEAVKKQQKEYIEQMVKKLNQKKLSFVLTKQINSQDIVSPQNLISKQNIIIKSKQKQKEETQDDSIQNLTEQKIDIQNDIEKTQLNEQKYLENQNLVLIQNTNQKEVHYVTPVFQSRNDRQMILKKLTISKEYENLESMESPENEDGCFSPIKLEAKQEASPIKILLKNSEKISAYEKNIQQTLQEYIQNNQQSKTKEINVQRVENYQKKPQKQPLQKIKIKPVKQQSEIFKNQLKFNFDYSKESTFKIKKGENENYSSIIESLTSQQINSSNSITSIQSRKKSRKSIDLLSAKKIETPIKEKTIEDKNLLQQKKNENQDDSESLESISLQSLQQKYQIADVLNSEDQNSLHANKVIEKDLFQLKVIENRDIQINQKISQLSNKINNAYIQNGFDLKINQLYLKNRSIDRYNKNNSQTQTKPTSPIPGNIIQFSQTPQNLKFYDKTGFKNDRSRNTQNRQNIPMNISFIQNHLLKTENSSLPPLRAFETSLDNTIKKNVFFNKLQELKNDIKQRQINDSIQQLRQQAANLTVESFIGSKYRKIFDLNEDIAPKIDVNSTYFQSQQYKNYMRLTGSSFQLSDKNSSKNSTQQQSYSQKSKNLLNIDEGNNNKKIQSNCSPKHSKAKTNGQNDKLFNIVSDYIENKRQENKSQKKKILDPIQTENEIIKPKKRNTDFQEPKLFQFQYSNQINPRKQKEIQNFMNSSSQGFNQAQPNKIFQVPDKNMQSFHNNIHKFMKNLAR